MRKTPLRIVWPFLNYMCCCLLRKRKKNFDFALKRSIRKRLALKISKSDAQLEDDPYLALGFGFNSYFDVMVQLMMMSAIISVLMLPIMFQYSQYEYLKDYPGFSDAKYTLGNIGAAWTLCG